MDIVQSGGKLLGKGYYGCIFQPPLLCKNKPARAPQPGKLGKLTEMQDAAQELYAAALFEKRAGAEKYLVLPQRKTLCEPLPIAQQSEKDLASCDVLQRTPFQEMRQYELDYGGNTLSKISEEYKSSDALLKVIDYPTFVQHCLEIGAFLTLNGYVHNDLHSKNIVMGADNRPRLIDYGRSFSVKQLNPLFVAELAANYDPSLGQLPPECTAMDGIDSGRSLEAILTDLRMKKPAFAYSEKFLGISRTKLENEFRTFWKRSKAAQEKDWTNLYKLYWPGFDSWGFGHICISMLRKLSFSNEFLASSSWKENGATIKTVLRGMLHPSPLKRLDCVQALFLLDPMNDLVTSSAGAAWLEHKRAQKGGGGAGGGGDDSDSDMEI